MPDFAVVTAFKATDRISPAFRKMSGEADRFGKHARASMGMAASASGKMVSAIRGFLPVLGAAGILKFANDSIEAWKIQETAIANVEAGLKSTGGAIGLTSKQLQNMASAWQKVGIFGDEAILQNITAQLLTFGSIGKENFDKMQGAAMDITAKLYGVKASGEQLRDVTIMLGKAMDDPAKGMTALRRRGIQFTEQQENMIKVMQATQGRSIAQAYLLKEIEKLYGGVNIALRNTNAGMEIAARNKLSDTMEMTGKMLIPVKQGLFDLANLILPVINKVLPPTIDFLKEMKTPLLVVGGLILGWKAALVGLTLWQLINKGVGWIKYLWMMREFITAVTIKQWLWNAALTANPIGLITLAVAALIGAIIALVHWGDELLAFFSKFTKFLDHPVVKSLLMGSGLGQVVMATNEKIKMAKEAGHDFDAPNKAREGTRQGVDFQGLINIAGAPRGTTISSKTRGAPPINMALVGID